VRIAGAQSNNAPIATPDLRYLLVVELNARFDERADHRYRSDAWVPSPMAGVERQMLDRVGDEVARATSLVRYAANSEFSPHVHTGGEEFLVLDGVFSDEHGDYPAGTYVRNPPTSSHRPRSGPGCVIFVKLWQFDLDDRYQNAVDINTLTLSPVPGTVGVTQAVLHDDARETVLVQRWEIDASVDIEVAGGLELLVLDGSLREGDDTLGPQDWLRLPPGSRLRAQATSEATRVWLKRNHLVDARKRFDEAFARAT